jgi:hypothetical protein
VTYSTKEEQTEKGKKETHPSQPCISKYNQRDSHPNASPEGHGTTPFAKCRRWSKARPLGAAMRLTASRQPYDISKLQNSKHPKTTPYPKNDSSTSSYYYFKPISTNAEQRGHTAPHSAPYGETARAPSETARHNHLHRPQLTQVPANVARLLTQQLKSLPPDSHCLQKPTARQKYLTQ